MLQISLYRTTMFFTALVLASGVVQLSAQNITTLAGNGTAAYTGNGAAATSASLNGPKGIAIAPNGTVYIADYQNFVVRKVDPKTNQISTYAGTGANGYSGDGGPAAGAQLSHPAGLALDQYGNLYITDGSNNRRIRKVTASGIISTVAGNGTEGSSGDGGLAVNALVGEPTALAFDSSGNLYFTDTTPSCQCVRKIDTSGKISRVAGNGVGAYSGDNGPALQASMDFPLGIAVDASGNIYVADTNNHAVRKIMKNGNIVPVAGHGGAAGSSGDGGPAVNATLNLPSDVAVDVFGNVYIADSGNNKVRKVDTNGNISTIAGTGASAYTGDNGPATQATLNHPWGLAADADGALYIGDDLNNVVRKIPSSNVGPPSIPASSAVNAASFVSGQAVAPGSYVAIFGSNLSAGTIQAGATPLPAALGNTFVTVNNEPAPAFFVSPGQMNVQIPFDIPNGTATIVVNRGNTASAPQLMGVNTYGPGLFMYGTTGLGIVVHNATFQLVTSTFPAVPGEYLSVYATGLGPVSPAVAAGQAAPTSAPFPLTTTNPTVTLGNQTMTLAYSGLAPALVGVYQLTFQLPAGTPAGNQTLQISVGGINANTAVVPIQ